MRRSIVVLISLLGLLGAKDSLPDYVIPGEVVFKISLDMSLLKGRSTATGITIVDRLLSTYNLRSVRPMFPARRTRRSDLPNISRIYVARYDAPTSPFTVARQLEKLPMVIYAEPRFRYRVSLIPNDSFFSLQGHLSRIVADSAWAISRGDPTIRVGIVDTGFDMDHPDLKDNYFTNLAELNGADGKDDDDWDNNPSTFVDDIYGWDFAGASSEMGPQPDNDPNHGPVDDEGYWVHGTHVAGLANAVTDNRKGVAGVAWNVRTLPIKASYDDTPGWVSFGYSGIVYAAEMGADIINCSWGGPGYSKYGAEAVAYATGLGSLIVAAAGNADADELHYPSAYEGVLGVAATNDNDTRAEFSNYGLSVDVSAPGVALLATLPDGGYGRISGTSMASPIVAGLASLVKSHYPKLTPEEVAVRVAGTTDNIDSKNPQYSGLLGTGRVNAYDALSYGKSDFVDFPPEFMLIESQATDSLSGNGDGILDRGETVHISATYRNFSLGDVGNFMVRLSTDDEDLTVTDGNSFPHLFPADGTLSISNEVSLSVSESARGHMGNVTLDAVVNGSIWLSDTLTLTIGRMPLLVVDDDFESCCGGVHVDGFYTTILDENDVLYGIWDHSQRGSPSAEALKGFPMVTWFTEWDFPSLDSLDRAALRDYLDGGGNLYISGQDLGWDLADPADGYPNEFNISNGESREFYESYLHATWGGDDAESDAVEGIFGDPISNGLSFNLYQPHLESDYQFPDWFTPRNNASLIFRYDNGKGMGLRYENGYRLVYTGVGLEAFGSEYESTPPGDVNDIQRTVLTRILHYLNFIHHDQLADTEATNAESEVFATITGDLADIDSVILWYKRDNRADFATVSMTNTGEGLFRGIIPAAGRPTSTTYFIEIVHSYYHWTNPIGAPESVFHFYAGPDTVPPVIAFVSEIGNTIDRTGTAEVSAFVTDNIGIKDVSVEYSVSGDTNALPMKYNGEIWTGEIVWENVPGNSRITYQITATDSSSNRNMTVSEPRSFKIVNWANTTRWDQQSLTGWDTGDGWGLHYFNPTIGWVINDSPGENYANNINNIMSRLAPIDLSPYGSAYFSFWELAMLEKDKDFGHVELSGNGTDWETVASITGTGVVRDEIVDLTPYISNDKVYLRFRMTSDEHNTFSGWYIDDIFLLVDTTFTEATVANREIIPVEFVLDQNFPNPFNSTTKIGFSLPRSQFMRLVIYDVLGRKVDTLLSGRVEQGRHEVVWDASGISSGIYFCRLSAGDSPLPMNRVQITKKLVLVK